MYVKFILFVWIINSKANLGVFGDEIKISLPLPGIEPGFLCCPTSSLVTVPTC